MRINHLTQHTALPQNQKPYPHPPIETPSHGIQYDAKGTHRLIYYLLPQLDSMCLEAPPRLLRCGQQLLPLWRHDLEGSTLGKTQFSGLIQGP